MPMMGLVKLTRDKPLNKIIQPLLLFYSPDDNIVDSNAILEQYARFSSKPKKLITVTDSGDPQQHILAGHIMSPQTTRKVTRQIVEFVQQLP